MPADPILYSFRRCPYAIRARLALQAAAIHVEHREVLLRDKPAAMLAISPKGTVPVLQLPDGQVLDESEAIMRWALARQDPEGWLNADPATTAELIAANDQDFKPLLDRYKYAVRHPEATQEQHRRNAEPFLARLEQALTAQDGAGLVTNRSSLVDVAIFPFIRQFAGVEPAWFAASGYPRLIAWLQRWVDSDRFAAVMQKYPLWQPADPPAPAETAR